MVASTARWPSWWRPETLSFVGLVVGLIGVIIHKVCLRTGSNDEAEARNLRELRLKHFAPKAKAKARHKSPIKVSRDDDLLNPSRYRPPEESNKGLHATDEPIEVQDGAGLFQQASCLLDTGNQHMTIVDDRCAARLGLLVMPGERSVLAQPDGYTTLRGVNPGAKTLAPIITATLRLRGRVFRKQVAVSALKGQDVLVGVDILRDLYREGFYIMGC